MEDSDDRTEDQIKRIEGEGGYLSKLGQSYTEKWLKLNRPLHKNDVKRFYNYISEQFNMDKLCICCNEVAAKSSVFCEECNQQLAVKNDEKEI